MTDELLTVKEVAARLKLNPQTVRRWIRSGRLRGMRVGARGWRVRARDAARLLSQLAAGPNEVRGRALAEEFRALREQLRGSGAAGVELAREARRELIARSFPPPTPEQIEAHQRAMDRLIALRAAFNRPGPTLQEILDEERREQEEE